eukprot:5545386-Pyramimonas_sp.AAC.2
MPSADCARQCARDAMKIHALRCNRDVAKAFTRAHAHERMRSRMFDCTYRTEYVARRCNHAHPVR